MYRAPLVSVVMPAYNVENYLQDAVRSLQAQDYKNWEIIAVDDASADDTLNCFLKLAAEDSRIRVISLPHNEGVAHARNVGLDNARGKYLYLLDPDDYIAPHTLSELVHLAESEQLDEITFDTLLTTDNKSLLTPDRYVMTKHQYEHKFILSGSAMFIELSKTRDHSFHTGRSFYRNAVLQAHKLRYIEYMSAFEDDLFYYQAMLLMQRVRTINKQYHYYRIREDSLTTKKNEANNARVLSGHIMNYVERDRFLRCHKLPEDDHKYLYKLQDEYYYNTILIEYGLYWKQNQSQLSLPKLEYEIILSRLKRDFAKKEIILTLLNHITKYESLVMIGDENYRQKVTEKFSINTEQYQCIYDANYHIDLNRLIDNIKKAKGIVLLFTVMYDNIKEVFNGFSLLENRDYIDGRLVL